MHFFSPTFSQPEPVHSEGFSDITVAYDQGERNATVRFVSPLRIVPELVVFAEPDSGASEIVATAVPMLRGRRRRHEITFRGLDPGRTYAVLVRGGGIRPSTVRFEA